jgi:hypothetical protein
MVAQACLIAVIYTMLVLLGADLSQIFRQLVRITTPELLAVIRNGEYIKMSWVQTREQAVLQKKILLLKMCE